MTDEHYDKVSLLLPMSGENNGTTFTDWSPVPKTVTSYGNAKTVTAQSKYYGSSGYFDGSGDYLTSTHFRTITGNSDFTVEAWVYMTQAITEYWRGVFVRRSGGESFGFVVNDTAARFEWWDNSNYNEISSSGVSLLNRWAHVAACRSENTVYVSLDGIVASAPIGTIDSSTGDGWIGGAQDTDRFFAGYMQDFRITEGIARYTSNFTPPTSLIKTISGIITDRFGQPCQRKVYAVSRPTDATAPQILVHGLSEPTTGAYELIVPSGEEVTRVVVSEDDDDPLLNDIVDRVIPA